MTTGALLLIGASSADPSWDAIDWQTAERSVRRLQMRIAKATRARRWGKVQALQRLLTHSFAAKLLAVRRVVRNRGRRTAGVDGVIWTIKIRGAATPYDPAFVNYFARRKRSKRINALVWHGHSRRHPRF